MSKNNVSLTAWVIVASHLALAKDGRWNSLVDGGGLSFYRCANEYCRRHFLMLRLLSALPDGFKLWLLDRALAFGAPQHFVLRKRAIAKQLQESMQKGVTQLVVIGGGFDPLALNTARANPNMNCIEIDMPGMHENKMAIARQCLGEVPANFHGIGVDLSQKALREVVASHPSFDPERPTLFVAEGVSMYLTEQANKEMLQAIRQLCRLPASFIFTAIETHRTPSGEWSDKVREAALAANNERFTWGMQQAEMAGFLVSQGYRQQYLLPYADLQRPYRTKEEIEQLAQESGEYLVYALAIG